ncbi:MAG: alcohol dehydrogenase catalytic domain-containing protein [Thermoflexales bacterium]|nr:alcohol dehydrogenase catalytic domain-containing protein [Thermoflexales bacterium]
MQGLWLEGGRVTFRADLPLPQPPAGEALIKVRCAGVCNTDLEMLRGYYPFTGIPGHEFVGQVVSPGEWQGRRVCGEINVACGRCARCRAGLRTHCEQRTALGISGRNGAFAQYLSLPLENLHPVPDSVPDDEAVFVEPLAAALQMTRQVHVRPADAVAVLGDGKLGLLCAQVLALSGCRLLAVGRHPAKLAVLAARGIQTAVLDECELDGPRDYDIVVECTGRPQGFELARRLLRPQGTLILKSTYAGQVTLDLSRLVVDEITVVGSRCGPFAPALDLLARHLVDVRSLVHAHYPLQDGLSALERAGRPGTLKVILDIPAGEEFNA